MRNPRNKSAKIRSAVLQSFGTIFQTVFRNISWFGQALKSKDFAYATFANTNRDFGLECWIFEVGPN